MSESTLVRKIVKTVRATYPDAYVRKLADRFTRGLPDILIIVQGKTLLVETKDEDGKISAIQRAESAAIARAGGHLIVAYDVETVMQELEEILNHES